jgi:orotate phosphoribosyltransferase
MVYPSAVARATVAGAITNGSAVSVVHDDTVTSGRAGFYPYRAASACCSDAGGSVSGLASLAERPTSTTPQPTGPGAPADMPRRG